MRHIILALAIIGAVLLIPREASACFCASPDLSRSIRNADSIFSAEAVEVSPETVVLEVEEVWKGRAAGRLILHQHRSSCTLDYKVGEKYLIYARRYKDWLTGEYRLTTSQCDRSRKIAEAEVDLARLRGLKGRGARRAL